MSVTQCNLNWDDLQAILVAAVKEANRYCHFSQRQRQMTATDFVQTVVWGWVNNPQASLNELALTSTRLGCSISAQGLDARIGPRAVVLLAAVLSEALARHHQRLPLEVDRLHSFNGIFLTDSTQIPLPDELASIFTGMHGTTALKLQVTFDYLTGVISTLTITDGNRPDQRCQQQVQQARANSLNLFDLGYFKQEYLRDIHQQGAFFLTRYQSQTALYDPTTGHKLVVEEWLGAVSHATAERACLLGGRVRLAVRVVARRLPQRVAAERRRKAKRKARYEGKTCTRRYLLLLGWDIVVTNLPAHDWPSETLFALYALRWQIELLFRAWKSQLKLAHFGVWRVERVLCQFYAHLLGCVLCHLFTQQWRYHDAIEYSLHKTLAVLRTFAIDILGWLAADCGPNLALDTQLEEALLRFARKDKRKQVASSLQQLIRCGLS